MAPYPDMTEDSLKDFEAWAVEEAERGVETLKLLAMVVAANILAALIIIGGT